MLFEHLTCPNVIRTQNGEARTTIGQDINIMNKHKEAFCTIVSGTIPEKIAEQIYGEAAINTTIKFQCLDNIREYHPPRSLTEKAWLENDAVMVFIPSRESSSGGHHISKVSIEIKTELEDLLKDDKMELYVGATEYMFLAVPSMLILPAIKRLEYKAEYEGKIGLIDFSEGEIVIMPTVNRDFDRVRSAQLMSSCFLTRKRFDQDDSIYQIHDLTLLGYTNQEFVLFDNRQVNTKYLSLFKARKYINSRKQSFNTVLT